MHLLICHNIKNVTYWNKLTVKIINWNILLVKTISVAILKAIEIQFQINNYCSF